MTSPQYALRFARWLERRVGTKRASVHYYSLIFRAAERHGLSCFNYGYADAGRLDEIRKNGAEPFQLELYRQTALAVGAEAFSGACVLEISSGLGGGLDFLARTFRPRLCVGLERAKVAADSSRRRFDLVAVQGEATKLRLPDKAFDVVLNVEASHVYFGDEFLSEAFRVLRPGGRLAITDSRLMPPAEAEAYLRANLERSGFALQGFRDITANVALSSTLDDPRREALLLRVPRPLRGFIRTLLGGPTTPQHQNLRERRSTYFIAVAARPG
jgi:SAM-dependent methyltransferase